MNVRLLRHAPTQGNAEKRYIGITDEPLSNEGMALARACGGDAALARVYVSPLLRTQQTAAIWHPNAKQVIMGGLAEMNFGAFENKNYLDLQHDTAYQAWLDTQCTGICPGGEDMAGFTQRVCEAFAHIMRMAAAAGENSVAIVAHGGTVMAVMSRYATEEKSYFDWHVQPCEGYAFEWLPDADTIITSYQPISGGRR